MKIISKISALLLGVLLIASCSQEQVVPAQTETEVAKSEGRQLGVNLSVGIDEARVYQDVSTSPKTTPVLTESNLKMRVVVTYNGVSEHQTLEFKKVPGANKATYSGMITVPAIGAGQYTITAALLGQADGTEYARLSGNEVVAIPATALVVADNNVVKSTVPYIAQTTGTLSADGKSLESSALTLKPSGTLLRIKVQNMTGREDTFTSIKIQTNAFVTDWSYDLSNYKGGNLQEGKAPSTATSEYTLALPSAVTLADKAVDATDYYLWVMPTKETTLKTKIYVRSTRNYDYLAFKKTTALAVGKLTTATAKPLPHMPITYFEPNPLNATVSATTAAGTDAPSGPFRYISDINATYFNSKETQAIMRMGDIQVTKTINGQEVVGTYYMPTPNEVRSIFTVPSTRWDLPLTESNENNVNFPWAPKTTISGATATYMGKDGILYALRFKGYDNNRFLMAYKYERVGTFALNSSSAIKITSRYIGTDGAAGVTINTVADPNYWANDNEDDATGTLYALGWTEANRVPQEYGYTGHMQIGNPNAALCQYVRFDNAASPNATIWSLRNTQPADSYYRPIRLFIRK
ncbi:MAG: hypothetical protein SPK09_00550 [Porphyromonas sp.]|nr:hypothetical protein [Porphyromonas sp.]